MSNSTFDDTSEEIETEQSDVVRGIKIGLGATLYLASLWTIIAAQHGAFDGLSGALPAALALGSALMVIIISMLWLNTLNLTTGKDEPVAKSTKKARRALIWSCVLGLVIVVIFYTSLGSDLSEVELMSNGPIPAYLAILVSVIYAVGGVYVTVDWNANVDEHERAALYTGLYGSFMTYGIVTPIWWLGQRAALLPDQDPMIMYSLILTTFCALWTYRRGG